MTTAVVPRRGTRDPALAGLLLALLLLVPVLVLAHLALDAAPAPGRRPLLQPVARPRGRAPRGRDPAPPAVRAVRGRGRAAWSWRSRGRRRSVAVPAGQTTVILAIDVSRSMCATDIEPNRLLAAEAAAAEVHREPGSTTQIGIVAFAGFAEIVQAPTTDQEVLLDVIPSAGDRTADGGRQRHPRVDRRHRRGRPERRAERQTDGRPGGPAPPARRQGRLRARTSSSC